MLPFSKVAIFDSDLCLRQFPNHSWEERLLLWKEGAIQKGADAAYLRNFPWSKQVISSVRDPRWLLLLPGHRREEVLEGDVLHFSWKDRHLWQGLRENEGSLAGLSCHSSEDLKDARQRGFAYAFLSPVFSTLTHPQATPLGLDKLASMCLNTDLPIIALGGMNRERERECLKAGVAGIAAIRYFFSFTET